MSHLWDSTCGKQADSLDLLRYKHELSFKKKNQYKGRAMNVEADKLERQKQARTDIASLGPEGGLKQRG